MRRPRTSFSLFVAEGIPGSGNLRSLEAETISASKKG
jgi:hypothetical protein